MFPTDADPAIVAEYERRRLAGLAAVARGDLTAAELATFLDVSRMTVYRWLKSAGINPTVARGRRAAAVWHMLTNGQPMPRKQKREWLAKMVDQWETKQAKRRRPGRPRKQL